MQKQCNQQILQEREIASEDKKSLSRKLQEMTSSMSALQSEMKEKDDKINSLLNQVRQMEATIRQQGKLRKIEVVVTEIKNPLATLVKLLGWHYRLNYRNKIIECIHYLEMERFKKVKFGKRVCLPRIVG